MDIRKILKENAFGPAAAYSHLSPLQIGVLKKLATNNGTIDPETLSPQVQDACDELISFGLINVDYSITEDGLVALKYAQRLGGSSERRQAMANKEKNLNTSIDGGNDDFNDFE